MACRNQIKRGGVDEFQAESDTIQAPAKLELSAQRDELLDDEFVLTVTIR